ncbi:MAG TPA: hypothetical protein VFQ91_10185 [Bryobacteraceae bacterium]|nr:hypothetical protein [Bryobacteraceae bacterium]
MLLTADPSTLPAGSHHATVSIQSPTAQSVSLPVRLEVSSARRKLLLFPSGLSLFTPVGGGAPQRQSFSILNMGRDLHHRAHGQLLTPSAASPERKLPIQ